MGFRDELIKAVSENPRVVEALKDPRLQQWVIRALTLRGRAQGAIDRRVQRIAKALNLATQRDLRALQRRIRDLESALRSAEERLIEAEDAPEAADRTGTRGRAPQSAGPRRSGSRD